MEKDLQLKDNKWHLVFINNIKQLVINVMVKAKYLHQNATFVKDKK